ncbi:MAG: hypothetical protein ACOX8W_12355, partial [bacterium]
MDKTKTIIANLAASARTEARLGYTNFAVFGGFSRHVCQQIRRLNPVAGAQISREIEAMFVNYEELPVSERKERVARLQERLRELRPGDSAKTPAGNKPAGRRGGAKVAGAAKSAGTTQAAHSAEPAKAALPVTADELLRPAQYAPGVGPARAKLLRKVGV